MLLPGGRPLLVRCMMDVTTFITLSVLFCFSQMLRLSSWGVWSGLADKLEKRHWRVMHATEDNLAMRECGDGVSILGLNVVDEL